jgi:hypothetical protein
MLFLNVIVSLGLCGYCCSSHCFCFFGCFSVTLLLLLLIRLSREGGIVSSSFSHFQPLVSRRSGLFPGEGEENYTAIESQAMDRSARHLRERSDRFDTRNIVR